MLFLVFPPFFGLVYIMYTLGALSALLIQLLYVSKKKKNHVIVHKQEGRAIYSEGRTRRGVSKLNAVI